MAPRPRVPPTAYVLMLRLCQDKVSPLDGVTPSCCPRPLLQLATSPDGREYAPAEFVARCHFASGQFGDVASTRALLALIAQEEARRAELRRRGLAHAGSSGTASAAGR